MCGGVSEQPHDLHNRRSQSEDHMVVWPRIVCQSLTALAVLIFSLSFGLGVSIIAASDAQAGSRHGGHSGRAYGGGMRAGSVHVGPMRVGSMNVGHMQAVRMMPVPAMRAHPAIAYTSRPYNAASYAPRAYHAGYGGGYGGGYAAAREIRYAAPVRQVRYVHYQPTAYHQSMCAAVHRAHAPRSRCVC
jgi:hypothetical protein